MSQSLVSAGNDLGDGAAALTSSTTTGQVSVGSSCGDETRGATSIPGLEEEKSIQVLSKSARAETSKDGTIVTGTEHAPVKLETYSVLRWNPSEFSDLPVAFGFIDSRKESRCIAIHRQNDFVKRGGKLFLTAPTSPIKTNQRSSSKKYSSETDCETQERHVATEEDIRKYPSQITVQSSFMSSPSPKGIKRTYSETSIPSAISSKKSKLGSTQKSPKKSPKSAEKETKGKTSPKKNPSSSSKRKEKSPPTKKASSVPKSVSKSEKSSAPKSAKQASSKPNEIACIPAPEPEFANTTGWIRREFMRAGGASKGSTDRYWYTPKKQIKIRSMKQVRAFLKCLTLADPKGDEDAAWKMVKQGMGS